MRLVFCATALASLSWLGAAAAQEFAPRGAAGLHSADALTRQNDLGSNESLALPLFDQPGDGALWVRGQDFKARFDRRGLEFIPFLGSDAPKDYPLEFSIASARVGDRELAWDCEATPERDGSLVTFHRGAFDETFQVGRDSIEHNFVLEQRVRGGDLVIRIRVEGELMRTENALGAEFVNERGGVHYGRATIVDARGDQLASATHLVGDSIEVRIPRIELERAEFPLTVDPVITSFTINSSVHTPEFPDTSYDLTTDTWLCVCQTSFSATDHDILVTQFQSSGSVLVSQYIDLTTADWTNPRVANCNAQDQFMVVAQVNAGPSSSRIRARSFKASDASMSTPFDVTPSASNGSGTYLYPDIGGDDYPLGGPPYCVAYLEVGNGVWCSRVSPAGTVYPRVQLEFAFVEEAVGPVRISKSNGHWSYGDQRWSVGWLGHSGTVNQIRQVGLNGQPATLPYQIGNLSTNFSISPLLDEYGPNRHYIVAFFDGYGEVLAHIDNGQQSTAGWFHIDANGLAKTSGSVETDGSRFYIVYSESNGTDSGIFMTTLVPSGSGVVTTQSHVPLAASVLNEVTPSIASKHSSGSTSLDTLCVYKRFAGTIKKFSYTDAILATLFY